MKFVVALHKAIDFLFCDRCPSNTFPNFPDRGGDSRFGQWLDDNCLIWRLWQIYEALNLWEEPRRRVRYRWPASIYKEYGPEPSHSDESTNCSEQVYQMQRKLLLFYEKNCNLKFFLESLYRR